MCVKFLFTFNSCVSTVLGMFFPHSSGLALGLDFPGQTLCLCGILDSFFLISFCLPRPLLLLFILYIYCIFMWISLFTFFFFYPSPNSSLHLLFKSVELLVNFTYMPTFEARKCYETGGHMFVYTETRTTTRLYYQLICYLSHNNSTTKHKFLKSLLIMTFPMSSFLNSVSVLLYY